MDEPWTVDFASVVCPDTGVSAREAAIGALVARDRLGVATIAPAMSTVRGRRLAMIEDVRVLTGVLAAEFGTDATEGGPFDAAHQVRLVHEATMRSDAFALCAAFALTEIETDAAPGITPPER